MANVFLHPLCSRLQQKSMLMQTITTHLIFEPASCKHIKRIAMIEIIPGAFISFKFDEVQLVKVVNSETSTQLMAIDNYWT